MSIKSLGKIAAVAAVAGLAFTACADDATSQARAQEETCGLLQVANTKAGEALAKTRGEAGPNERAAFTIESAALDLRNHSFDRSDAEPTNGDTAQVRTALQVNAAYFQAIADQVAEDAAGFQDVDAGAVELDGMNFEAANTELGAYCNMQGGF